MAQLQSPFNAQQFDPTQGGGLQMLPVGKHPVVIIASEIKATKDNSGGFLELELQVIDGPGKDATGLHRINLYSSSDKARRIAESQFAALCYATGVFMVENTQQLHGKPFAVDVVEQGLTAEQEAKKAQGQSVTPFTQVRKILDMQGQEPKAQGQAPAAAPQPQQQPAQAPQQQPAAQPQGWGSAPVQAPAQAPAAAPAAAWSQAPAQQPAGGQPAQPAWGKR